eukprot:4412695-Heterocapsa_arctica.AAC.1
MEDLADDQTLAAPNSAPLFGSDLGRRAQRAVKARENMEKDDEAGALEPEELATDLRNESSRRRPPGTSSPWHAADALEPEELDADLRNESSRKRSPGTSSPWNAADASEAEEPT